MSVLSPRRSKKKSCRYWLQLRVTCGLVEHPYGVGADQDDRLGCSAQLFSACGLTLSDGTKMKLVEDVATAGLEVTFSPANRHSHHPIASANEIYKSHADKYKVFAN